MAGVYHRVTTELARDGLGRPAWRSAAASVAAWAVVRAVQIAAAGLGSGFDVGRYLWFARVWRDGAIPYAGFHPEYPPAALPLFAIPLLVAGPDAYARAFAAEMAAFDVAALLLVVAWARRLWPEARGMQAGAAGLYLLVTAALYPVLYARFDLAPAAVTLAALYLAYGPSVPSAGRAAHAWSRRAAAFLLGVAAAMKLWPLALAPLLVAVAFRRGGWRGAASAAGLVGAGLLLPALPFVPAAGVGVAGFLRFHAARGIQLESTWASLAMLLADAGLSPVRVDTGFGAIHFVGPAASFFAACSTPALLLLVLAPQVASIRAGLGGARDAHGEVGLAAACAAVLGFLVGGKVLSPQFMVWIAPLLPLAIPGGLAAGAALAAAALTTAIYPYLWPALLHEAPGHAVALACIVARNLVLVGFYAVLLRRVMRFA